MRLGWCSQTLERGDLPPLHGPDRQVASGLGLAVHQHHASATLALAAAELGAAQAQFVAQYREQIGLVIAVKLHRLLIDMEHGFWGIAHTDSAA